MKIIYIIGRDASKAKLCTKYRTGNCGISVGITSLVDYRKQS